MTRYGEGRKCARRAQGCLDMRFHVVPVDTGHLLGEPSNVGRDLNGTGWGWIDPYSWAQPPPVAVHILAKTQGIPCLWDKDNTQ